MPRGRHILANITRTIFPFENPEYKDLILEGLYKAGMPRPD